MFGIRFLRARPTTYVIHYRNGKVVRQGAGLSFFYFAPRAEIVQVALASNDVPFAFNEVTADFQDVTIQGQLTYRVADPVQLSKVLDYSVTRSGLYRSDDPTKLADRMIHATQLFARRFTQRSRLRDLLTSSTELIAEVTAGLRESAELALHGVDLLGLSIVAIKPNPDMGKAMQAAAREELLRQADEAVYARRNAAVDLERTIKENELNTEIAVEEKTRQVREKKMAAEIAVEEQRANLVGKRVQNERQEAEARAFALQAVLEPLKGVDWRTLMAVSSGAANPQSIIALAFRDLADNAQHIGELNISPELLNSLLRKPRE
ncbi:MAG: SPFH domain-containing protein [Pirellulales bacterium]